MKQNRKTRVLHLIKSLGRGGAEKLIPETAALHDQEQYAFHCIYFYRRPSNIQDELEEAGIQVTFLPSSNLGLAKMIRPVAEYVREHQIDLIHCHLPWAGVLGRLVGVKSRIPVVYTEHNMWERYNMLSRWMNKLTFDQQDFVIPVSDEVKSSILKSYHVSSKSPEILTIANGVNTNTFQRSEEKGQAIRKKLGIPKDAIVIGQVAVFRVQKRLGIWVKVAKSISRKFSSVHFILVGDGSEMRAVKAQIGTAAWSQRIHLVGTQANVLPYLSAMNIYMITSAFEGLPVAMLEGMACDLPVIGTKVGGIGEVIREGVEGYLAPKDEPEKLVEGAEKLIEDHPQCREMGHRARQRVEENFSLEQMVSKVEEVYQSALRT
ncbi:glycosyltransferase [Echinicola sp. CAU 1574]|uniref:Glycosyltransferase n=1 Tax=Echinicola arenosa TaxID=2774144 RepID=A0ABR9ANS8_9BACT|nr:glycosyltransferase [Echinicola arenosa]MBD8490447.1 glycosyltransferase [Echinicola arenosa]